MLIMILMLAGLLTLPWTARAHDSRPTTIEQQRPWA